ncbi:winged helix-turn-helix domain-containing protein [Jiulongibacter sediminis]|uniref:Transcriptional regulator n=1 Tax=Jiulongibacter sediminis TaxID=1605367 RepID=A0A0P7C3Q3_9BACT|nr:transcriptional regulator [Jiulongibacter sediminis]KPM48944.1 transcriptional regulator [Jiulongibacter sediminis]TBX25471.1 transcriptional regulator [Jiulongibacter sediminis]
MNLDNFHKAFENKVRLGIMSVLMVNDAVSFNQLKELLELTDGNLASHLKALEKFKFIEVKKEFIDRKPNTTYLSTRAGKTAFEEHLAALEKLIKEHL